LKESKKAPFHEENFSRKTGLTLFAGGSRPTAQTKIDANLTFAVIQNFP